jgi:uncharacterized SAM-binding protein YcdF (DUF218 family)
MSGFLYQLLKALLLPPGSLILLLLLALANPQRRLLLLILILFYLLSSPFVVARLSRPLEDFAALSMQQLRDSRAQAIVVLSGGRHNAADEYAGDTVGSSTLERLRYAAWLHRRSGLPVIVSGGSPFRRETPAEAQLAAAVLTNEFGVEQVLQEGASANTRQNARLTLDLLQQRQIRRIVLVTHAWHMPRALQAFAHGTVHITPAATGFYHRSVAALQPAYRQWLPDTRALLQSRRVLHEYLGQAWYGLLNRLE